MRSVYPDRMEENRLDFSLTHMHCKCCRCTDVVRHGLKMKKRPGRFPRPQNAQYAPRKTQFNSADNHPNLSESGFFKQRTRHHSGHIDSSSRDPVNIVVKQARKKNLVCRPNLFNTKYDRGGTPDYISHPTKEVHPRETDCSSLQHCRSDESAPRPSENRLSCFFRSRSDAPACCCSGAAERVR